MKKATGWLPDLSTYSGLSYRPNWLINIHHHSYNDVSINKGRVFENSS